MTLRLAAAVAGLGWALFVMAACAPAPDTSEIEARLEVLETKDALIAIADGLDAAVDAKDWDKARSYFADDIGVSFSPEPDVQPMAADDLIGGWRTNLFEAKTSFHLRGNHDVAVSGDTAKMVSHGYAWNKLPGLEGGDFWEVWGVYEYAFERQDGAWKITEFVFRPTHQRGNTAVATAPPLAD